jgi:hypothetical protein
VNCPLIHTVASAEPASRNFPLGKDGDFRPAVLAVVHSDTSAATYKGEMFNASAAQLNYMIPSSLYRISATRYWNFERSPVSNLDSGSITLYYGNNDTVPDRTRVAVVHDDGNSRWVDYGGTGTADVAGSITSNAFTSFFTKFSFGFPPSPLPVEFIKFSAAVKETRVYCDWTTASELNNDFFTVERSSNGKTFESIHQVNGSLNSTQVIQYQYVDESPLPGDSYYRIRQTDVDGHSAYTNAEHIFIGTQPEYVFFPNPSSGVIHVTHEGKSMAEKSFVVQDMHGKDVPSKIILSPSGNEVAIDLTHLNSQNEFYILNILSPAGWHKEKVLLKK